MLDAASKKKKKDVREWLRRLDPDLHRDGIFEDVPRWQKFVSVLSGHVGKYALHMQCNDTKSGHFSKHQHVKAGTLMVAQLVEALCYKS
jgi:hypothetical protein